MLRTLPDTRPLTRSERDLLAAISRYCRTAGWRYGGVTGRGDFVSPDLTLDADWWSYRRGSSTVLQISTLSAYGTHTASVCSAEVGSVAEAVDIACAYGLLPAEFSSAFGAGQAFQAAQVDSTPRYTDVLQLTADVIGAGYLLAGSVMDGAGVEQPAVESVTAVRQCTDAECVNRLLYRAGCVVLTMGGELWTEPGDVHFVADTMLQVRVPAGEL